MEALCIVVMPVGFSVSGGYQRHGAFFINATNRKCLHLETLNVVDMDLININYFICF